MPWTPEQLEAVANAFNNILLSFSGVLLGLTALVKVIQTARESKSNKEHGKNHDKAITALETKLGNLQKEIDDLQKQVSGIARVTADEIDRIKQGQYR